MDTAVITTQTPALDFDQIRALSKQDMQAVDRMIQDKIQSGVPTIPPVMVGSGSLPGTSVLPDISLASPKSDTFTRP